MSPSRVGNRSAGNVEPNPTGMVRGTGLLLLGQVAGNAGFFAASLIIARALGPSGRGAIAFFLASTFLAAYVGRVGFESAASVYAARDPDRQGVVLTNVLLFTVPSSVIAGAALVFVMFLLPFELPPSLNDAALVAIAGATVATAFHDVSLAFLLGCRRYAAYALGFGAGPWVYCVILLALGAGPGLDISRVILAWIGYRLALGLLLLAVAARGARPTLPDLPLMREMLGYGVRGWPGTISAFLNLRADQWLMGFISTEAQLGAYAVAVSAADPLLYAPIAAAMALLPVASASGGGRRTEATLGAVRALLVVTATGIVVALALGPTVIPVLFGPEFEVSVRPFLFLLPAPLGFVLLATFGSALRGAMAPGRAAGAEVIAAAVGLTLNLVLVPTYGATGAAAAASLAFIIGGVSALLAYRRLAGFEMRRLRPGRDDLALVWGVARRAAFAAANAARGSGRAE